MASKQKDTINSCDHHRDYGRDLGLLWAGVHHNPHQFLGIHHGRIHVFAPQAHQVTLLTSTISVGLTPVESGLFIAQLPVATLPNYRLQIQRGDHCDVVCDPYQFPVSICAQELEQFRQGKHPHVWTLLGARRCCLSGSDGSLWGVSFTVWAPHARGVSLVSDDNGWDPLTRPMRMLGNSGVWEIFCPECPPGIRYKFCIRGVEGSVSLRADPYATYTEVPPLTASRVWQSQFCWHDDQWMSRRDHHDPKTQPMSIYEVHLGSWKPGLGYRQLAHELSAYLHECGFTHLEILPITEHPFGGSWGYQVTSYFAPTARFGDPDDFRYFVDYLHQQDIGVILDWVPGHFPDDSWALSFFDGSPVYEADQRVQSRHPDWGTYLFDFTKPQVCNFLLSSALWWISEFHLDGLRVDAVASMLYRDYSRMPGQWIPNQYGGRENLEAMEFLRTLTTLLHHHAPGIVTIAEESTRWPGVTRPVYLGGLGFSLKWNMTWMHDVLEYFSYDPVHRSYHHHQLLYSLRDAYQEDFLLALSHDEVVHGKGSLWSRMSGDSWAKAAHVRALLAYQWAHPGKQLVFMGQEFGQHHEWSHQGSLAWSQREHDRFSRGIARCVTQMNRLYRRYDALWSYDYDPTGFAWIDCCDWLNNVVVFLRRGRHGSVLVCVGNFSGIPHMNYRIGLPCGGYWHQILNTDAHDYGGRTSNESDLIHAQCQGWHSYPYSALINIGASSVIWIVPHSQWCPDEDVC